MIKLQKSMDCSRIKNLKHICPSICVCIYRYSYLYNIDMNTYIIISEETHTCVCFFVYISSPFQNSNITLSKMKTANIVHFT